MRKLSDADVARLREQAHEGRSPRELADEFGVTRRHIGRLLRGEQRQQVGGLDRDLAQVSVVRAVDHFLADIDLSRVDEVAATAARVLAMKLEGCAASETAAAAQAAPQIAARLIEVLDRLRERVPREPDPIERLQMRRQARLLAAAARNGSDAERGAT